MSDSIWLFFEQAGFQPHGYCLMWRPDVFWTHVISDGLTAAAYLSIPLVLVTLARRRPDVRYGWLLPLFGLFIVACGVTHLFGVWTMWVPSYGAEGVAKAVTAAASLGTAAVLWPLLPALVATPSPRQLEERNALLAVEIESRRRAETDLRRLNDELELRVAERTAELERANADLRRATEQRRALLDTMVEGVVGYDADGRTIYCNASARRILGLDAEDDAASVDLAAPGCEPEPGGMGDDEAAPGATERSPRSRLLAGETLAGEEAAVARRGGGEPVPCSIYGAPLRDADGRIAGAVATFADISREKRAEESQRLLIAELNHRVRNTLATVSAMVRISSASVSTSAALASALLGRIGALARTHSQLTANRWRSASLRRLIAEETEPFASEDRIEIAAAPDAALPPKAATDLALAIHELATNAAKHGAWSGAKGRVSISWRRLDGQPDAPVELVWRESGGPTVAKPQRRGFGGTLLASIFSGSASGGVELRHEPDGVVCVLRAPTIDQSVDAAFAQPQVEASALQGSLAGRRVLVVEDEQLIAIALAQALEDEGATVVGPAHALGQSLGLIASEPIDAAVLDVNLGGLTVAPAAETLAARATPFLFVSGYGDLELLPPHLRGAPLLTKPIDPVFVAERIGSLLAEASTRPREEEGR